MRSILIMGLWLTVSSTFPAAQGAPTANARADAERRARLDALPGNWTVTVTYFFQGREMGGTAEMESQWFLDHHFVRQEYTTPMGGRSFVTVQFLGYDGIRRKFSLLKMDSNDDAMLYSEGDLSADGRVMTLMGQRSDMMTRTVAPLRQVFTFTDSDHFTIEWFMRAPDGSETRVVTMVHTRKKPAEKLSRKETE